MIDQIFALQVGLLAGIIKRVHEESLTPEEKGGIEELLGQIPSRSDYKLSEQLSAIIQMITLYPTGLSMLLGRVNPPTSEQVNEMILAFTPTGGDLGVRVVGGASIPQAERLIYTEETFSEVIAVCGGWPHISDVARCWMKYNPNGWAVMMDHTRWVKTKITRIDGSTLKKVADAHGISVDTVRNTINSFPKELAEAILATPLEDKFDLRSINNYPAI
jgi:hypothetical protein